MREVVRKRFFEGKASGLDLASDVKGSSIQINAYSRRTHVEDMDEEFAVTSEMAIKLCDLVLNKELPVGDLQAIGFALIASDHFVLDSDVDPILVEVIADWSCPEVNYALTIENVRRCRRWLTREDPYPER